MDFFDVVTSTRAIRRYRPDPVSEDDLAQILFAATRAPSGSNSQPFRFLVLRRGRDDPRSAEARAILKEGFRRSWSEKRAQDGYRSGAEADPSSRKARMASVMDQFADNIDQAPVIVLVCLQLRYGGALAEGASVYPACQNLLLSARALGYGGVMTIWHQPVEEQLVKVLGVPENVRIAATIPLGRPVGRHGPVRRRPLGEVVYDGAWGEPATWAVEPSGTQHAGGPGGRPAT